MDVLTLIQAISHLAACWRSHSDKANRTTSPAKSRDVIWRFPKRTSSPWLCLEILSMKIKKQDWWQGTLAESSTHWKSVCICAEDSDTDITLVYKNLVKTVMSHISLNMVCYNQFTTSTKSNNKTPLWFRSGSQFLTWALKLEPLPRPHLKTQRTAVLFHIHRQQSESYPMWLKMTRSDPLAQHNSDA